MRTRLPLLLPCCCCCKRVAACRQADCSCGACCTALLCRQHAGAPLLRVCVRALRCAKKCARCGAACAHCAVPR